VRQADLLAGLGGAVAVIPLLALGLTVLRGRTRAAFSTGAQAALAAALGVAVVAAARGGAAPWRGVTWVEVAANAVLAVACLCAVVPPLGSRLGGTRSAEALATFAGGAVVLRGGFALGIHTGLAVRDDVTRLAGVVVGVALVGIVTAAFVAVLRSAGPRARLLARPWLVVACGIVAVSTAVALVCDERFVIPIQLRAPAGSTFVSPGSTSETILAGLTGVAHSVPRAQVAAIVAALVVGAALALWQTRRLGSPVDAT
jgi:hypothetical protein